MITVGNKTIENSNSEKIIGVYFHNKLNFDFRLKKLCKKASQKIHALARLSAFMSIDRRKIIMNAFIHSQFSYCPLIWMCHSKTMHTRLNKIHERSLRIVYQDNTSSFTEFLERSNSITIQDKNIQYLAIEIYKALNNLSSPLMSKLFGRKDTKYSLRNNNTLISTNVKTTAYGTRSLNHLGPKIWKIIPDDIKCSESLDTFKHRIKSWTPDKCPCTICRPYVHNLGYID